MEGGSFSKWGSRLGATHIRLTSLQHLHGWRAARFQNWALALAPRTFVLKVSNSYKDGGRFVFKMGLSPWRRAHSSYKFPTVTSARRPWPSGSRRFKPADAQRPSKTHHQRPNPTPSLHASGAMKPAAAGAMKKPTKQDGGRLVFKMGLSPEPSLSLRS